MSLVPRRSSATVAEARPLWIAGIAGHVRLRLTTGTLTVAPIAFEHEGTSMTLQQSAQNMLRQYIEQIERLEEEKKALTADIRDKFLEAKAQGFDPKIMKKVISLRKRSKTERQEEDAVLETYLHALGMLAEASMSMPSGMNDATEILDAAE
jgi:uncharacterized protein (UPF0335 family)